jgi:hypothetical protein
MEEGLWLPRNPSGGFRWEEAYESDELVIEGVFCVRIRISEYPYSVLTPCNKMESCLWYVHQSISMHLLEWNEK